MAVGIQLQQLVQDLRAEAGHSLNAAHGLNQVDTLKHLLRRTQEELWITYDWPDRMIYREVDITAGNRFVKYPQDMPFNQVNRLWAVTGTQYLPMDYQITPELLSIYNPLAGHRGWPARRWQHNVDDPTEFEIWPPPNQNGRIRMFGQKSLQPLLADTDTCTVDGVSLVMFAAAEVLARQKQEDAQIKLQKAQSFTRKLLSQQGSAKKKPFVLGGGINPNELGTGRRHTLRPYFAPPSGTS